MITVIAGAGNAAWTYVGPNGAVEQQEFSL